jgi:hypothetical protein
VGGEELLLCIIVRMLYGVKSALCFVGESANAVQRFHFPIRICTMRGFSPRARNNALRVILLNARPHSPQQSLEVSSRFNMIITNAETN